MKSAPILFSAPMVLALLADLKTQTRRLAAPRWAVGDHLYVRENYRVSSQHDGARAANIDFDRLTMRYEADGRCWDSSGYDNNGVMWPRPDWMGKLRPSIYHPRARSRLTLVVSEIRSEPLRSISEADAVAEGVREPSLGDLDVISPEFIGKLPRSAAPPLLLWEFLWKRINGDASWNENPTVYATTFRAERRNIDAPRAAA